MEEKNKIHYCNYPGEKLMKSMRMEIGGQVVYYTIKCEKCNAVIKTGGDCIFDNYETDKKRYKFCFQCMMREAESPGDTEADIKLKEHRLYREWLKMECE